MQRLRAEPLGERGFAIAQAPPNIDPADGTLMRRLVRKRLKDANAALDAVEADVKGVGLVAIYEYAEHENVGSFVKSLDPGAVREAPAPRRDRRRRSAADLPAAVTPSCAPNRSGFN